MENRTQLDTALPFAALSVEQAGQFISNLISKGLQGLSPKETDKPIPDLMNIRDTSDFLCENGYYIKKNSIYNLVSNKSIPFRKIGRRVVFSRSELIEWVKEKIKEACTSLDGTSGIIESANRKR